MRESLTPDPNFTFLLSNPDAGTFGLPNNVVVDPRTMKIVFNDGDPASLSGDAFATADQLAQQNASGAPKDAGSD